MALNIKMTSNNYGVDINYWMITLLQIDKFSKTAFMKLCGFISKDIRIKEGKNIDVREYSIYPEKFDTVFDYTLDKNEREMAYDYIKTFDEFKEAIDC